MGENAVNNPKTQFQSLSDICFDPLVLMRTAFQVAHYIIHTYFEGKRQAESCANTMEMLQSFIKMLASASNSNKNLLCFTILNRISLDLFNIEKLLDLYTQISSLIDYECKSSTEIQQFLYYYACYIGRTLINCEFLRETCNFKTDFDYQGAIFLQTSQEFVSKIETRGDFDTKEEDISVLIAKNQYFEGTERAKIEQKEPLKREISPLPPVFFVFYEQIVQYSTFIHTIKGHLQCYLRTILQKQLFNWMEAMLRFIQIPSKSLISHSLVSLLEAKVHFFTSIQSQWLLMCLGGGECGEQPVGLRKDGERGKRSWEGVRGKRMRSKRRKKKRKHGNSADFLLIYGFLGLFLNRFDGRSNEASRKLLAFLSIRIYIEKG